MTYYSQFAQDVMIHNLFFPNKKGGVFVDFGAHNGKTINNTLFFEETMGWTGLCVEADPDIFSQLVENRPKCKKAMVAVSDKDGVATFRKIKAKEGTSADYFGGLQEKCEQEHKGVLKGFFDQGLCETIQVTTREPNGLLLEYGIDKVDYLSLDIEGGELDVLKALDLDRFKIRVIDVENNYNNPEMRSYMESKGYSYVTRLGVDEVYVKDRPEDIEELIERADLGQQFKLENSLYSEKIHEILTKKGYILDETPCGLSTLQKRYILKDM